jgi:hypothetical protein
MKRLLTACAVALPLVALTAGPVNAEVKTREKSAIKFEGMLGKMMGMFGGKAARDGILSTTIVKGNRKVTMNDTTGQIIDLSEEKIYDLDLKKKEYKVTTFDEMRRRMKEAQERAEKDVHREEGRTEREPEPSKSQKEYEVDFNMKETGQKRQIAGHEARQVIMTITVREKGRTLEEGGGIVTTADSWLGPKIPAMKEALDFDLRYWQKLHGGDATVSAEQMAAVLAMFPLVANAQERMRKENVNLDGAPLATTTTFEAVKTAEQVAQETEADKGGGGGGLGGMLAKRMMKKDAPKPRATIFTVNHEYQEISTTVAATDLELPAGFTEKK